MSRKTIIEKSDVIDVDSYAAIRQEKRKEMMTVKKNRRLHVGPALTVYFESYDTMLYQVLEMMNAERGGDEQLQDELTAFNPLIPKGQELTATVMLEYTDADVRARELARLGAIEQHIKIEIGSETVSAVWEDDVERTTSDGKTSSVHFLHFPFTDEQIAAFKAGEDRIIVSVDHENYGHMAVIPQDMRQELQSDFQ